MNLSFSLFRLQSLDSQLFAISKRLAEIERILAKDERVLAAQNARTEAEKIQKSARTALNEVAAQVAAKRLKREYTQASLFSGKVRNPKELQDLQAESEALKRTISKLEDEQLEAMLMLESADEALKLAQQLYQETLNQKQSESSLLIGEQKTLSSELPTLESQRQALLATVPDESVTLYQSLLRSKGQRAVVAVVDGCCEGCGVMLSPREVQASRSPSTLARCKTCGRILFMS